MTLTIKTWQIRDQLPSGEWSAKRPVTLAQYLEEIEAAKERAEATYKRNAASVR